MRNLFFTKVKGKVIGEGIATSKQGAKEIACAAALETLKKQHASDN